MNHLSDLIEQSGMSARQMADALGINHSTLRRILKGELETHEGLLSRAALLPETIEDCDALVLETPELRDIHPLVFRFVYAALQNPQLVADLEYLRAYFDANPGAKIIPPAVWSFCIDNPVDDDL